jgi:DNA-binding response OmpR family regulator
LNMPDEIKPKRILIIEDDSSLGLSLSEKFRTSGFDVEISVDGETGLRIIEEKRPDIILLDLILPKKNGFRILAELNKIGALPGLPVIVITNLESTFDIERAFSYNIMAYLIKANYSLDEIVKKVRQVLI